MDAPCLIVEFRAYNDEVINRSMVDILPVPGLILVPKYFSVRMAASGWSTRRS